MRISDWSSDVCSSDLQPSPARAVNRTHIRPSCRTQTEVRRQRLMMIRTAHEALLERKHPTLRFTLAVAEAEATTVDHTDMLRGAIEHGPAILHCDHERDRKSTRLNSSH